MQPQLIPVARSSPTECHTCGTHDGPFIDTGVDKIEGRTLLCVSRTDENGVLERTGCIEQMARLAGSVDKEEHAELQRLDQDRIDRIALLEQHIRDAAGDKVVSLNDVETMFDGAAIVASMQQFGNELREGLAAIADRLPPPKK